MISSEFYLKYSGTGQHHLKAFYFLLTLSQLFVDKQKNILYYPCVEKAFRKRFRIFLYQLYHFLKRGKDID